MITSLTPEQEAKIAVYREEALRLGHSTEPLNEEDAKTAVRMIAKIAEIDVPTEFVFCDSPKACQLAYLKAGGDKASMNSESYSRWLWAAYYAFYKYIRNELFPETIKDFPLLDDILYIQEKTHYIQRVGSTYFLSRRPTAINVGPRGLHCTTGLALGYADGFGVYALNGVRVSKKLVMTPADEINPMTLIRETNVEIRREIWRKIGSKNIVKKLDGKVIDTKTYVTDSLANYKTFGVARKEYKYTLYTIDLGLGNINPFLHMVNPSTADEHFESVPKGTKTVDEALAKRNSMEKFTFPEILS